MILKGLLRRKKIIVSEPSPSNTSSSSNDQNTRDLESTSYSPFPLQIPFSTQNLRIHEQLSTSTSLETVYTSPPPSYQPRTPGTQTIGPSMNQFIGHPSPNQRNRSKSIGVTSSNVQASTNPFHPHIYSPEDRVTIELIEYGCEGLLQEHPAATDPVPVSLLERPLPESPSPSHLAAYSPNPTTPPYHTASASPVTEGEPHIVHPTLAVRPPTPTPGQRRAEVDKESEEELLSAEHLQPVVPFQEPPSVTPSLRIRGIWITLDPGYTCIYKRSRQEERTLGPQEQFWVGLLPSHYEEQQAIHLGTEIVPTGHPHYYTFILKVVREWRNPLNIGNLPLSFCQHPHHLYYLSIRQDCNCTETLHHREQWTSHCLDTPLAGFSDPWLLKQLTRVNIDTVDPSWTTYELYQEWITRHFGVIIDKQPLCSERNPLLDE